MNEAEELTRWRKQNISRRSVNHCKLFTYINIYGKITYLASKFNEITDLAKLCREKDKYTLKLYKLCGRVFFGTAPPILAQIT